MPLTLREKIAHLYRRLGFGPTVAELDQGEIAGLDATIKLLIDYETAPSNFPVHPYEFIWNEKADQDAEPGAWRFRPWWGMAMVCTKRPLQEKLALFWHSHFAVSDSKVENGLMMLEYIQGLRKNANGKFIDLLKFASTTPAMMRYLDTERMLKGHPNENFAREVMELFTMGIGSYTEQDIKEVSRALTGWGMIDAFWELGDTNTVRMKKLMEQGRPSAAFCYMDSMRDDSPKTILGVTKDFRGEEVLEFLAKRPETAHFISTKMWEFFAYANPEPGVVERIAKVFQSSNGDIKQVMYAIVKAPEFWSDKCYLKQVKSPADYVIGVARQMGIGDAMLAYRGKDAKPDKMIPRQNVLDQMWYVTWRMEQMGLNLLYPPDVSGWKWGSAWATPAAMTQRMQYHGLMIWNDKGPWVASENVLKQMKVTALPDAKAVTKRFCEVFDLHLKAETYAKLEAHFTGSGGPNCTANAGAWAGAMYHALRMMSAAPEMHLC